MPYSYIFHNRKRSYGLIWEKHNVYREVVLVQSYAGVYWYGVCRKQCCNLIRVRRIASGCLVLEKRSISFYSRNLRVDPKEHTDS